MKTAGGRNPRVFVLCALKGLTTGLLALLFIFVPVLPSRAAITGTGDCAAPGNPLTNPLTADYSCTGNLTVNGGSVLVLQGDIALTVNGTLMISGIGSEVQVAPSETAGVLAASDLIIGAGALINSSGKGCGVSESYDPVLGLCQDKGRGGAEGFGEGVDNPSNGGGGGGGFGGKGGNGSGNPVTAGGSAYGMVDLPFPMMGSGGGSGSTGKLGGAGGGAVQVQVAGVLNLSGEIRADGLKGDGPIRSGGGGSGGSIKVTAGTWTGAGRISANGGNGGGGNLGGGGGAGGRILVVCGACPAISPAVIQAEGGSRVDFSGNPGQAGSVFVIQDQTPAGFGPEDTLVLGGNGIFEGDLSAAALTVLSAVGSTGEAVRDRGVLAVRGNITIGQILTINSGGGLGMKGDFTLDSPDILVNGELALDPDGADPLRPFSRVRADRLTVNPGGALHGDGGGCGPSESYDYTLSPPACRSLNNTISPDFGEGGNANNAGGGGGGGFGGSGGAGNVIRKGDGQGGYPYGTADLPVLMPGSGGGDNETAPWDGGAGGSAVLIEAGNLVNEGRIGSNGENGRSGANRTSGGGSGGSLHVRAGTLSGSNGIFTSNGGNGGANTIDTDLGGGGGGGGRIRIDVPFGGRSFSGRCEAAGGTGSSLGKNGSPGSVVFRMRPDGRLDGNGSGVYAPGGSGDGGNSNIQTVGAGQLSGFYRLGIFNNNYFCSTENTGFDLSWVTPGPGWIVKVLDSGKEFLSPFTTNPVSPQTERILNVLVSPPRGIPGGLYEIILDVRSPSDPALVDSVRIRIRIPAVDVSIDGNGGGLIGPLGSGAGGSSDRFVSPGNTVVYGLTLVNKDSAPAAFKVNWNVPTGWVAAVNDGLSDQAPGFTTNPVAPGDLLNLYLKVTPPVGAENETIIVDVSSPNGDDSVSANAKIPPTASAIVPPDGLSVGLPFFPTPGLQLNISWMDRSDNENGFQLERAVGSCSGTFTERRVFLRDSFQSPQTGAPVYFADTEVEPGTVYCYRVRAFFRPVGDPGAGVVYSPYNPEGPQSALSSPPSLDEEAPGTILDLSVVPGSQQSGALSLTWTAPADDFSRPGEGSAAQYDIRYSRLPIVPVPAGPGNVAFLDADRVEIPPVPSPAGTAETALVDGLSSNTVYFFAVVPIDEAGNRGAMSNLAGGDQPFDGDLSGRTALRRGYNLVSIPLLPPQGFPCADPSSVPGDGPECVFGDDIAGGVNMSRWLSSGISSSEGCFETYPAADSSCIPPLEISSIVPGEGYFLLGKENNSVIDVPAGSVNVPVATLCGLVNAYSIPLSIGWNIIGNPFPDPVVFSGAYVRRNGTDAECVPYGAAVANGWVGNAVYEYDGVSFPFIIYTSAVLEPWSGYWLWVPNNQVFDGTAYELILTRP